MNVVLDTNCLLMSLSRKGRYYPVWKDFLSGKYTLCLSNEILTEYEKILTEKLGHEIASDVIQAILDMPNTRMVQIYYHLRLVASDPDDDKFVDCAFKTNARFIVTQDHHFDMLRRINYPKIDVIGIDRFLELLKDGVN